MHAPSPGRRAKREGREGVIPQFDIGTALSSILRLEIWLPGSFRFGGPCVLVVEGSSPEGGTRGSGGVQRGAMGVVGRDDVRLGEKPETRGEGGYGFPAPHRLFLSLEESCNAQYESTKPSLAKVGKAANGAGEGRAPDGRGEAPQTGTTG